MKITPRMESVSGDFDTDTGKLVCVKRPKYVEVLLCFKETWNVQFAKIVLHDKDLYQEGKAVFDHACALGDEIVRRWNQWDDAPKSHPPEKAGRYLLCVFEWTGLAAQKPAKPYWTIRDYSLTTGWERPQYTFDHGGYTNFEPVAWKEMPPLPNTEVGT